MKKQNLLKLMAMAIVSSTILLACIKDENNVVPVPDQVKKLMNDWKITDITTPKKTNPSADSSIYKTCMSDDIIKFNSAGFDFQDGTSKCDSVAYPYSKGIWAYDLAKDSIQLGATTPKKYMSWKVSKLNDSIMQIKYIDSISPANKITKTISFKH
jgi:hypothetical protein